MKVGDRVWVLRQDNDHPITGRGTVSSATGGYVGVLLDVPDLRYETATHTVTRLLRFVRLLDPLEELADVQTG